MQCVPQVGPSLSLNTMNRNPRPPNSSASAGTRYSVGPIDPALHGPATSPICGPSAPATSVHPGPGPMSKTAGIVLEINQLKQRVAQLEGEKEDMAGQLNRIKIDARNEKTRLDDIINDMKREMAETYEELNGRFDRIVVRGNHDDGKTSDDEDDESSEYDSEGLPIHNQETRMKIKKSKEACKQNLIKVCYMYPLLRSKRNLPEFSLLFVMSLLKPWAVPQLGSLLGASSLIFWL